MENGSIMYNFIGNSSFMIVRDNLVTISGLHELHYCFITEEQLREIFTKYFCDYYDINKFENIVLFKRVKFGQTPYDIKNYLIGNLKNPNKYKTISLESYMSDDDYECKRERNRNLAILCNSDYVGVVVDELGKLNYVLDSEGKQQLVRRMK